MTCTLKRVGAADIDKISKSPEAASAMIDDNADRDFPLEEVRMPGCLGLLLRLTPIKVTQVAERPKGAPSPEIIDDPDRMDLEVWDVMNYFLTGTATEGELPGGFLVNGGKEMSTEDDEAQLRLLTPSDVEEIDRHLQSLSRDDLRARINIPLMINQRLVSKPKEKGAPEETMEYLEHVLDELDTLKVFVAGTRGKSAGLLVMLN